MNRRIIILTCLVIFALSYVNAKSPDPEKIKKNLNGTWQFFQFWNPYKNEGEPGRKSTDPKDLYTAYTFFEDGRVIIWSLNSSANNKNPETYTWGVVLLKSSKGKDEPIIKIVDSSINPKDQKAIEMATSGVSCLVVQSSKTFLSWIKIPEYKQANSHDWQSTFKKVTDMPPESEGK